MTKIFVFCILIVTIAAFHEEKDDDRILHPKFISGLDQEAVGPEEEWKKSFWINQAQKTLKETLEKDLKQKAKNVIFFIGDGMGIPTLMAARTLMGQRNGKPGENERLSFEKFPVTGLVKTYCVNGQVADSACSATAYLGGVKANDGTIGVDANVRFKDCDKMMDSRYHVESIAHMAIKKGKSAGIVTTTRVTHASPAGAFAHTSNREWENDARIIAEIDQDAKCTDIAYQLVMNEPGKNFSVILGGGRTNFLPVAQGGSRITGNLIDEWKKDKEETGKSHEYITNKEELKAAVERGSEYLLGLFHSSHMEYNMLANQSIQPTLEEMTEAAIKTLAKNNEGFFLFVEGGRIDTAHHEAKVHMALDETIELSKAVNKALELTDSSETLIIVSADHSHVMSISGYPSRGNDILGASDGWLDLEGLKTLTLTYANGPGYRRPIIINETDFEREDLANDPNFLAKDPMFMYPGLFPHASETHGGEDVAVFAYGPWQHLFTGNLEQNMIPHILAFAMCIGDGIQMCDGADSIFFNSKLLLIIFLFQYFYNKLLLS